VATERLRRAGLAGAPRDAAEPLEQEEPPLSGAGPRGWTPGDPVPLATWAAYAEASGADPQPPAADHGRHADRRVDRADTGVVAMPRAVVVILILAAAAVGLGGYYFLRSQAEAVAVPPPVRTGGAAAPTAPVAVPPAAPASSPEPAQTGARLLVHVAGRVGDPGVVELPAGARVGDAVTAAGGADDDADLSAVNLARPVGDGEQVYVPAVGEEPPPPAGGAVGSGAAPEPDGGSAGGSAGGTVDLNTATLAELQTLPGVGPVLAQRILDWRTEHGSFASVDELNEVSGIGDATLAEIAPHARV
jgi:competence protein ComEA